MNKLMLVKLFFAASTAITISAFAQKIEECEASSNSGYFKNSGGMVIRSRYNLCWRTGYWKKSHSMLENNIHMIHQANTSELHRMTVSTALLHEKVITTDILFAFDKADLKSTEKVKLDKLVSKIGKANLGIIISTGHTDSVGSVFYNKKLSEYRAKVVKAYLLHKGIKDNYVYTNGRGESQPVISNKTAIGRAENRRVEVKVISQNHIFPN